MAEFEFFIVNSLCKVFPDHITGESSEPVKVSILSEEVPAIQLVYKKIKGHPDFQHEFCVEVTGLPTPARIRDVELVSSAFPCYEEVDENYLTTLPGLFPDLLLPKEDNVIVPLSGQYKALWIDIPDTKQLKGSYSATIQISTKEYSNTGVGTLYKIPEEEKISFFLSFELDVADASLSKQELIHTEWFHSDCLADYYKTAVFSEEYWRVVENQIRMAGTEHGINMLMAPVFTPALDTAINGERTTVQLVTIEKKERYTFNFDKLVRWCAICRKYGIEYIEVPHFFTQWGAKATPKIIIRENGKDERMFGWHVPADDAEYRIFLEQFIPALQEKLRECGYEKDHIFFHISDEPSARDEEGYQRAYHMVSDLLDGWQIIDALSEYPYYEKGLVKTPIPSSSSIQEFIDHKVPCLWVYYCCGQTVKVPNRFFAMPSARNRIMGLLMYLYDIKGFLHWGYNFYNSRLSKRLIDPFFDTHGTYAFPSGDPFLVYPGTDGEVWSSLRAQVQMEGLYDMRALKKLEELAGRKRVLELVYEDKKQPFTFEDYPQETDYLVKLRERVTKEINRCIEKSKG